MEKIEHEHGREPEIPRAKSNPALRRAVLEARLRYELEQLQKKEKGAK